MTRVETDFLVLGSGVAGLRAAIELAEAGRVIVVSKGYVRESNSESAQGGIAAALGEEDTIGLHLDDTIRAGQGLCREEAVKVLVEEGRDRIRDLMAWGARFDLVAGRLAFAREGAHSRSRILSAGGDATGTEIVRVLMERTRQAGVTWYDHHFTVDLLLVGPRISGAILLDEATGRLLTIQANAVILATGGAGQVYARTTNPPVATGDGLAMALRAGAALEDMEFVQFHPTALVIPRAPSFLLTEALRGEGAILRNGQGEAFMARYHSEAELAPRDLVARAIWQEMAASHASSMFLDATHLGAAFLRARFPRIVQTCQRYGLDITEDVIPVAPSAHFLMGGVKTDLWGVTTLPGLLACGEVACTGVHGANRLASNSLLEGLVFGARAGQAATRLAAAGRLSGSHAGPRPSAVEGSPPETRSSEGPGPRTVGRLRRALRQTMWQHVGIVREAQGLKRAAERLATWEAGVVPDPTNRERQELVNLISVGHAIAAAAFERTESVGAHHRLDSRPEAPGRAKMHVLLQRAGAATLTLWRQ